MSFDRTFKHYLLGALVVDRHQYITIKFSNSVFWCSWLVVRLFLLLLDFCLLTLTEPLQACFYCMIGRGQFFLYGQNLASLSADFVILTIYQIDMLREIV